MAVPFGSSAKHLLSPRGEEYTVAPIAIVLPHARSLFSMSTQFLKKAARTPTSGEDETQQAVAAMLRDAGFTLRA